MGVPQGHRPHAFVAYCSAEPSRLWAGDRFFTMKWSQEYKGHFSQEDLKHIKSFMDEVQEGKADPQWDRPITGPAKAFARCIAEFSPKQLNAAFLLPLPGDPLWTPTFLDDWCRRWPGFDRSPYDEARCRQEEGSSLSGNSSPDANLERVLQELAAGRIDVADAKTQIRQMAKL